VVTKGVQEHGQFNNEIMLTIRPGGSASSGKGGGGTGTTGTEGGMDGVGEDGEALDAGGVGEETPYALPGMGEGAYDMATLPDGGGGGVSRADDEEVMGFN
jgi:hypothetical protein